jgi:hypothetical protein
MHETAKDVHRTISDAFGEDQSVPLKVKPVFGLGERPVDINKEVKPRGVEDQISGNNSEIRQGLWNIVLNSSSRKPLHRNLGL